MKKFKRVVRKGGIYTIEAAIAAIMLISIISLIGTQKRIGYDVSIANYKEQIFDELKTIDSQGLLRVYALRNDSESIKNFIQTCKKINCKVVIFDKERNLTDWLTETEIQKNIASVSYIISGYIGEYSPREIRVYFWW
ncbi:MAG: hypothetical protein QXU71_02870 [Candidatus Aenigmatarchaeota archaeon]